MAVVVTSLGQSANTSGATLTLGSITVPSGSLIVVCIADKSSATPPAGSLSDGGTNAYATAASRVLNGAAANGFGEILYAYNSVALSGATFTYTKAVSGSRAAISAFYATGIQTGSDPLDSAATQTATGASNAPTVTSGVPTVAGDLFVGVIARTGAAGAFTQDSGSAWATPPVEAISGTNGTTDARIDGGTFVNAVASALTYAPTFAGTAVGWAELIVAFKASNISLTAAPGSYTETGVAALFSAAQLSSAGSFAETGVASLFNIGALSTTGSYALTGNAALFKASMASSSAAYAISGGAGGGAINFVASVGAYLVSGVSAAFASTMRRALYLRGTSFWKGRS